MAGGPGQGVGRPIRNETPYLVPIVGDWENRPGGDPWNPSGNSPQTTPTEERWLDDLEQRNVWQARHGGYQVHYNSVVFAGTWTKTFTRMTSMEAACESGRHAVNAILDHYIWVGIRRCRPSRRDRAPLADSIRVPRPGIDDPGSDALTGRRLLLHRGYGESGAAGHPHPAQYRRALPRCVVATPLGLTGR